jgi:hypothetical protein
LQDDFVRCREDDLHAEMAVEVVARGKPVGRVVAHPVSLEVER